ncbi:MAG: Fic family protein [Oscillospiraceae bacterium]|jgi:fido (protein-threonine AMPylation protein)|nr:Fic family protein [Oscillospiraceae bacterium]
MDDNTYYVEQAEPDYKARSYNWKTAIGLQRVDGLTPSEYLIETANANISGEITLGEAERRIAEYYEQKPTDTDDERRSEEADKVSAHIAQILAGKTFKFAPSELLAVHRRLFDGVFDHAGKLRDCNLSKSEWVLGGESVVYDDYRTVRESLNYDFDREKAFDYSTLGERETVDHIVAFITALWQIHPFREGNTRTIAVFTIKYLRTFGYELTNDTFEKHSLYFRNALVRANFNSRKDGIIATQSYLNAFFENLLFGGKHDLRNRDLHVSESGLSDFENGD